MSSIKEEVCIVVVLFNPSLDHLRNLEFLSSNFFVVAIDNSDIGSEVKCSCYVPLNDNKGIAAAQNIGIRYANSLGYKFVLLLDQDSRIDESFVNGLYENFKSIQEFDSNIGYIGPIFIDEKTGGEYKNYTDKEIEYTKVQAIIASGSLISIIVIDKVGMMDESLFIDLVDFEWCWRANSMGYSGYMTSRVQMLHSIGKEYHNWHGFVLGLSAPFRYYYQYRNTLWLLRRDYVPGKWKLKSVRRLLDMILVPLVSKQGWLVLKYMIKGIKDGLFKKNLLTY